MSGSTPSLQEENMRLRALATEAAHALLDLLDDTPIRNIHDRRAASYNRAMSALESLRGELLEQQQEGSP